MERFQSHLKEIWWLLILRGLALVLFGVVAIVWPGVTLLAIATALAVYLIVAGVVDVIAGIRGEGRMSLWFLTLILGLAEIGVAVYLLKNSLVLSTFIAVIGIALIAFGILEIVGAFEPRQEPGRRFLLVVGGALSLIAGFIVVRYPASSGLAFVWVLGVWGLVSGALQIATCLNLRAEISKLEAKV